MHACQAPFELPTGKYRAKFVVRDKATGRLGTVIHDFEVPDLQPFRVSTPVLSDVREGEPGGPPGDRLAILARRDFQQGGQLFCQVEVYRAVKEETSGMPRVSLGYEVRHRDGTLLASDAPRIIRPTPEGALSTMIGVSLESASPGDYELFMSPPRRHRRQPRGSRASPSVASTRRRTGSTATAG